MQGRLGAIRDASGANDPHRPDFCTKPRPQHIQTGKLFCGSCGGVFGNSGRDYLASNAAKMQAVCDNHRTIRRQVLKDIVLDALRARLMEPSLVALFISEFTVEWNRLQADAGRPRAAKARAGPDRAQVIWPDRRYRGWATRGWHQGTARSARGL
ncbi:zinc ribbon domain-containing protein [Lichenicoccus roseus]|uniref:zinc ribbon domain-containing protein n=1 Tax=Lichenicoccus roseus TaxID=2683649 RepID=UPI0014867A68|nr:zinc ribbon domain-containing protein [Lichenicoccus roseus]